MRSAIKRYQHSKRRVKILDAYWNHEITAQECAKRLSEWSYR